MYGNHLSPRATQNMYIQINNDADDDDDNNNNNDNDNNKQTKMIIKHRKYHGNDMKGRPRGGYHVYIIRTECILYYYCYYYYH
jgi:hypothetical protein